MKKVIGIVIALVIVIAAICGIVYMVSNDSLSGNSQEGQVSKEINEDENLNIASEESNIAQNNNETDENKETTQNGGRILIAFFSRADENYNVGTVEVGNTEIMARFMKDYLGDKADTFKIDPVNPYPADYKECTEVATEEKNSNARPEFKNADSINIDNYDTIFIGYPIWWGDVPMIINTFLEKYDFSGKTIIPFNTHEGSGNSGTFSDIKSKMKSSNVNTKGLSIQGKTARQESSRSTVENWLKELGF